MSEEQSLRLPSTEVTRLDADDTIEIPLTAEDTLALAQAAEERQAVAILDESEAVTSTYLRRQYLRPDRWRLVLPASLLGVAIGVALGVCKDRYAASGNTAGRAAAAPGAIPQPI